jgi:hypothetical protein
MLSELFANDIDIKLWQVLDGKITQVNIQGSIINVKEGATKDPMQVAKDFLETFNISFGNI